MELLAPCKINLFLEIKNRRKDGYHTLESVMQTISLFDKLILERAGHGISLKCNSASLPVDERNLVYRAASSLKKKLGIDKGVKIYLEKNIPLGAGLGGGSSDAACVLKGLVKFWNIDVSKKKLTNISTELGVDVPFFLSGGASIAKGIGEKLEPLKNVKPASFVLVYPGFEASTKWVYENLAFPLTKKQKIHKIISLMKAGSEPYLWGKHLFNRLEQVVLPKYSVINSIKETLRGFGCHSLMSGSGSAVFGIAPSLEEAERISLKLDKFKWKVWVVQSVL